MKQKIIGLCLALMAGLCVQAQIPTYSVYADCSRNGYTTAPAPADVQMVDLGLSVKWASCNVGANAPEEYGNYYAWGEVVPKPDYSWETYKYCNGTNDSMTKYCTNSSLGTVDNKTTLEAMDDAATYNWGGSWRMPTDAEWTELREQCTWTWTTRNGVNGYEVTSNVNGNSIFLPAAGSRSGTNLNNAGSYGYFWSSSLDVSYPNYACYVLFGSGRVNRYSYNRSNGQSVRPVCPTGSSTNSATLTLNADGCGSADTIVLSAGTQVKIQAVPDDSRHFAQWSDGNTDNPRTITLTQDTTFTAEFVDISSDISDIVSGDTAQGVRKIFRNGQVVILRGDKTYTILGEQL